MGINGFVRVAGTHARRERFLTVLEFTHLTCVGLSSLLLSSLSDTPVDCICFYVRLNISLKPKLFCDVDHIFKHFFCDRTDRSVPRMLSFSQTFRKSRPLLEHGRVGPFRAASQLLGFLQGAAHGGVACEPPVRSSAEKLGEELWGHALSNRDLQVDRAYVGVDKDFRVPD